jgi:radical SAM protein with 4Fe4S-binding SPASM domain
MCPQGLVGNAMPKDTLTLSLFGTFLDRTSEFADNVKLLRVCGMGEPLMNPHLSDMMAMGRERGCFGRIEVITNGILLTPAISESLCCSVDRIIISVNALDKMLADRVSYLYGVSGDSTIHVKTTYDVVSTPKKQDEFFALYGDICDEIQIEHVCPIWPRLPVGQDQQFRWGTKPIAHHVCPQIFKGLEVQANGDVIPCCVDWERINLLGNIATDLLVDIWNGRKLRVLRESHLHGEKGQTAPCRDCRMNDYCETDNLDELLRATDE